jgi:bacteriochlorophyllide a dehydrogenase
MLNSTKAIVLEEPERLSISQLMLDAPGDADVTVDISWSGISTGTERLLWSGRMPAFPGMGYPLVPGYESVGVVVDAGVSSGLQVGDNVFVPGAKCFGNVRGLFGGAAQRVVLPGARAITIDRHLGESAVLLALAATAYHAIHAQTNTNALGALNAELPELIVGHGVLGRIMARLVVLAGKTPTVWETNAARHDGALGYRVIDPANDPRRDYKTICDVSGDAKILDSLIPRLSLGGEIILAGFYDEALSFTFPPAFMREARIRVAAQWQPTDLFAVKHLAESGALDLTGLITHRAKADDADNAYRTAFSDSRCLKMILDWRN